MPKVHSKKGSCFINKLERSSILRYYLWKYRYWVGIGLLALLVVDVLEILPPFFLKQVVDKIIAREPVRFLTLAVIYYMGVSLVQAVCRYAWRMYLVRSGIYVGRDLRSQYTHHLFNLSNSFFEKNSMGSLMSLATNDVEAVRVAIGSGLLVFADALIYLFTVPVAMWLLSPKLTLLVCLPLPLVPWIVMKNEKKVHERFEKVQECFGRISAMTQENLNGIRTVKAFAKEDAQIDRMKVLGEEYVQLNLSLVRIQTALGPSLDLCMSMGLVILLFVGGRQMIDHGDALLTLGTFVAFQRYIQKMVWPMAALGMSVTYYQRAVSSSERIKEIFSLTSDVQNSTLAVGPRQMSGRIEFRNLNFAFPGSDRLVLKNINLVIEPGERIAFLGGIGSGKSALLSLIPRLYPVKNGCLFIDHIDINDWSLEELRKQIGYVSQEVFLFSETVRENVGFGLHEKQEGLDSYGAICEAARIARVHEDVTALSSSYDTRLEEGGNNLSGGQKQRLTLARALAKDPSILILDDALSAVDVQTEEHILHSLDLQSGYRTQLIAAHRISTTKKSDRLVILNDGKIVQAGSHTQLVSLNEGEYLKYFRGQTLQRDLESFQYELG